MSEKNLLPLHRINSTSAKNIGQYLRRKWVHCLVYAALATVIAVAWFAPFANRIREPLSNRIFSTSAPPVPQGVWDGWDRVEKIFAFGDSYTSIDFEVDGVQPTLSNPLGNPEAEGYAGSGRPKYGPGGPLWIHPFTMEYNASVIRTYDFARGGSTIDRAVVSPVFPTAATLKDEVDHKFLPNYASKFMAPEWVASSTLFSIWFGINDIIISYRNLERVPSERLLEEYAAGMLSLFHAGARNFLLFNVPPIDRPFPAGKVGLLELAADIADFNRRLAVMRTELMHKYPDLNIFFFDAHAMFQAAIAAPESFEQTRMLRDTRGPCDAYDLPIGFDGEVDVSRFDSRCAYPADQYFWSDNLHPTHAVHNATAALVVEDCMSTRGRKRFCS